MRKLTRQEILRREVRREWWGADAPSDPNENVRLAADCVSEILRLAGLTDGIEEGHLRSIWTEVTGEFVAKCSEPVSLKRGCLTIRVTQPAMRFHLEQMRGSLLSKIQQTAANQKIQSLRFSVG